MYSALYVATAPAEEPVTVDLARRHLRVDTDDEDDLIGIYLSAARMWAESYLSRALVQQQLRWVVTRSSPPLSLPYVGLPLSLMVMPLWFPWSALQQQPLQMPRQPVISIDQVSTGTWGQPDVQLQTGTDYDADPISGRLRMQNGWQGCCEQDHLVVLFTAGNSDPAVIDKPIVQAVLMLTAFLYENRGDAGGEMPDVVRNLLSPYRLISFG